MFTVKTRVSGNLDKLRLELVAEVQEQADLVYVYLSQRSQHAPILCLLSKSAYVLIWYFRDESVRML